MVMSQEVIFPDSTLPPFTRPGAEVEPITWMLLTLCSLCPGLTDPSVSHTDSLYPPKRLHPMPATTAERPAFAPKKGLRNVCHSGKKKKEYFSLPSAHLEVYLPSGP